MTYRQIYSIANRAGWMVEIVGILPILALTWWLLYLANRYPGNTILEIIEITAGKVVGRLINTVFILLIVIITACVLNYFASLAQTFLLPNTPTWVVMLVVTTVSVFMAHDGIEVLARFVFFTTIFTYIIYFSIVGLMINQVRIENITPIFVISPAQFTRGLYLGTSLYAEAGLLFLMVMAAALPKPKKYYKALSIGSMTNALFRGFGGILLVGITGIERVSTLPFSHVIQVQSVEVAGFLYGLEIIMLASNIMLIYSVIPVYFYSSWIALKQICNNWKPDLLLGVLFVAITGTAIGMNSFNAAYAVSIWLAEYVMLPFVVLVLVIASVGCWVKGRGKTV